LTWSQSWHIVYRRRAWVKALLLSRPRAQISNHGRACTQVLSYVKAELGFFHFLEIVRGWLVLSAVRRSQYNLAGTFHRRRSRLVKTGFFMQVRELKIQKKNPGSALCQ
jgi:hypothetical protein